MEGLAAKVYSRSLFELARSENVLEKVHSDLGYFYNIMRDNKELEKILYHPKVSKAEKKEIIKKMFFDNFTERTMTFIYVLIDKNRLTEYVPIIKDFNELYDKENKVSQGIIETSEELNKDELEAFEKTLSESMGLKVVLKNVINKNMMGGAIIKIGDRLIDASIAGQLLQLKKELLQKEVSI